MEKRAFNNKKYQAYLESIADLSLKPFHINPNVPLRYHPDVDDYTMSGGMARTPKGRIWLAWFGCDDNHETVLLLAHSDDGGHSFSDPDFIVDPGFAPGGTHISALVANIWTAPDGRLHLFVTQSIGYFDGRAGVWQSSCDNPDDNKPIWSLPARIWHGAALNKPTVLDNKTILLPISLWDRDVAKITPGRNSDLYPELDARRGVNIIASKDEGLTWEWRGYTANPTDRSFDEPMILEREDHSLLMYLRNKHGMTQAESHDEGATWTIPVVTPFSSASARFFLRKLESGNALLVRYNNTEHTQDRSHLTAFLSRDDGKTWEGGLLLDERQDVSYPDGYQDPDGIIRIQYDHHRECGEILMASFTEEDVLAGRNISGKVRRRQPLIQSYSALHGLPNAQ